MAKGKTKAVRIGCGDIKLLSDLLEGNVALLADYSDALAERVNGRPDLKRPALELYQAHQADLEEALDFANTARDKARDLLARLNDGSADI